MPGSGSQNVPTHAPRGRPPVSGPPSKDSRKPEVEGRVYCIEAQEDVDGDPHNVVAGTFLVNAFTTRILFDAGATHSFVNSATAKRLACHLNEMNVQLCVTTLVGSVYQAKYIGRNYPIIIQGRMLSADLVLFRIQGYDVILGMDWLTKYKATIDCERKNLTVFTPQGERLVHKEDNPKPIIPQISATRAYKMVKKGCPAYLCVQWKQ